MNKRKKTIILGLIASVVIVLSILTLLIIKNNSKESKSIRIIGTSDLHGKMLPFDYTSYTEDESGSVAQLATAIREFYDENTYLVDVGDSTQGNMADLFVDSDVHPMIMALNKLKYDLWVIGNHEFDYKPEILGNFINDFKGTVLTGNLYRSDGTKVCDGYKIIEKNGIRVAFIGMTTPNDSGWSKENKDAFDVTDSLEETRKIIDQIKGKYDVLVGLYHMDIYNEFDIPNSGVEDICNACPEFDVMVASHGHRKIEGDMINGVLVVENADKAQTMSVIDLDLKQVDGKWTVEEKKSESIEISKYKQDPVLQSMFIGADRVAKADATSIIGKLEGDPLVPKTSDISVPVEDTSLPATYFCDTAEIDLINDVMMYYADCDISCAANNDPKSNIKPGEIHKCDISLIYRYDNNLCKVRMTGAQLKKFMESNVEIYQTYKKGDKGVSIKPETHTYDFYIFDGVKFDIDVSEEEGNRIKNLTYMDGKPIEDKDELEIAVNGYLLNSKLLRPGTIYEEGDMPTLVESDICAEKGSIRDLIIEYIKEHEAGDLHSVCDENWKIIGY